MKEATIDYVVAKGVMDAVLTELIPLISQVVALLERQDARLRVIEDVIGVKRDEP